MWQSQLTVTSGSRSVSDREGAVANGTNVFGFPFNHTAVTRHIVVFVLVVRLSSSLLVLLVVSKFTLFFPSLLDFYLFCLFTTNSCVTSSFQLNVLDLGYFPLSVSSPLSFRFTGINSILCWAELMVLWKKDFKTTWSWSTYINWPLTTKICEIYNWY